MGQLDQGVQGPGQSMTKLGKFLYILKGMGTGALIGATQPTPGQGYLAAQENQNQQQRFQTEQQQRQLQNQVTQQNLAQMPWEITRKKQMSDLDLQIKQREAQGLHSVYKQEDDGTVTLQSYDYQGRPVGDPIKNVASGAALKPHLSPKPIINPHDPTDQKPYQANYNRITGQYEELDGTPIAGRVSEFPTSLVAKQTPALPPPGIAAQVGPVPVAANAAPDGSVTWNGTKYPDLPSARRAWGKEVNRQTIALAQAKGELPPEEKNNIATGVISGDLPPDLKGYRGKALADIQNEMQKRGFNLTNAQLDYQAVQKHIASLNSGQQLRLRQTIQTATESLPNIENLYREWQQLAPLNGVKAFNKAELTAAKNLPGRMGAVAQALDGDIADLTSELGNIYMGGNSPTDKALGLAHENLSANWNQETFEEALRQVHKNIGYRYNSIQNAEPMTPGGGGSRYYPPPANTPAPPQGNFPAGVAAMPKPKAKVNQ
jgi:hypothetical protein